jgi:glycosyltransferase involved in cell wall biosynthesis
MVGHLRLRVVHHARMRVAFVTEVWTPSINGVVTRLTGTIEELRRRGDEVLVIAPASGAAEIDEPGLRVRLIPTFSVRFVYGGQPWGLPLPRVARQLEEFEPDVVHVVNPALLGIAGVMAAHRRGYPLVCSYHTDIAAYAEFYHLAWIRPLIWKVLSSLHRKAEVNLGTSGAAVDQLTAAGVPRTYLWRRAVDLERFHPADPEAKTGRPPRALYVGRLAGEKGLEALAELTPAGRVPRNNLSGDLELLIVGDGPARDEVMEALGSDHVTYTGRLEGEQLAEAYRRADLFVFPSRTDTLGLVMLEALASGLPVVAAESPASCEVLRGCAAGRIFSAGDPGSLSAAVADVLAQGDLREDARAWVRGFGWAAATNELVLSYHRAIQTRAAATEPVDDEAPRQPRRRWTVPVTRRRRVLSRPAEPADDYDAGRRGAA